MSSFREFTKEAAEAAIGEEIDPSDAEQLQADSGAFVSEIRELVVENERLTDDVDALRSIANEISRNGESSLSSEHAVILGRVMAAGTGLSMESYLPSKLTMEAIEGRRKSMVNQILLNVANIYQRVLDWYHHNLSMFNLQHNRLKNIERALNGISKSGSFTVNTKITKYMLVGTNAKEIQTGKEYMQEFKKLRESLVPFIDSAAELADEDLFASFKQFWAFLTLNTDKLFSERFIGLCDNLEKAAKSAHMKVEKRTPVRVEMATDVLLGQGQLVVIYPPRTAYDPRDMVSIVDSMGKTYMGLYRKEKYRLGTIGSGWLELEIDIKEMKSVIKDARELLDAANSLISATSKISTFMTGFVPGSAGGPDALSSMDDYHAPAFTRTSRLINRISMIIVESVPPGYNFALGNVKKAATVAEKFIKKAA